MRLNEILADCEYENIAAGSGLGSAGGMSNAGLLLNAEISGIAYDSRKVMEDNIFVAIRGENFDGHDFINDAIRKGAAAVVHEEAATSNGLNRDSLPATLYPLPVFIKAEDSRDALACISNNFYERPSENLTVIGVTGTNGKTTTAYIIKSILEAWGRDVGLIGTINYIIKNKAYPALHTTPESPEFQGLLSEMVSSGCSHVVAEVSSHSLSQKRVDHTKFVVVAFTNLTRDHLDFHRTMEDYYAAKRRLFTELLSSTGTAAINIDDEWGRRLLSELNKRAAITYGINGDADVRASDIENSFSGVSFNLQHGDSDVARIESPLLGITNVYNVLAAVSAALSLGIPIRAIRKGIKEMTAVRGRFEKVDAGQDFLCIVDYAHTPDALERLIATAKTLMTTKGEPVRVITVFGCGGNRDKGKRPLMGEIATRLSDFVVVTSDNPRNEEPIEIVRDIETGITKNNHQAVINRRDAITAAVKTAGPGDILLIAGKGHEDYQEIKGIRHRFSDKEEAEEAISKITRRIKREVREN